MNSRTPVPTASPRGSFVRRRRRRRPAAAIVLTAALIVPASACSLVTPAPYVCPTGSPGAATPATTSSAASASSAGAPTIAVLVEAIPPGRSRAAEELRLDRRRAMEKVLDRGFAQGATLLVGLVDTTAGARLAVEPTPLKAVGNNPLECGQSKRGLHDTVLKVLDREADGAPDVTEGLTMLASTLDPSRTKDGVDVVVLSSMLGHAKDLSAAGHPGPNAPHGRSLLQDCAGWHVYVVGPGRTAGGGLASVQLAGLKSFWQETFHSCGGNLWGFQPQLTVFPASGPLPAPCVEQPFLADVLFDTNRAEIRADAGSTLEQIVEFVRRNVEGHPSRTVEIAGHTDSDGTVEANLVLSERRAQNVASKVAAQLPGLDVTPYGLGQGQPEVPNDTPEHKARNRRVVVTVLC